MTPRISFAKTKLDYPLYAADFDPYGRGYLVVSGGGGESKTGVANKISVLDVSNPSAIENVAELDLSRDEDSANTLANLATKDGLITFAGINSSTIDQQAGKNQHFRTFEVQYPRGASNGTTSKGKGKSSKEQKSEKSEKSDGRIALLGKTSLFKPDKRSKPEAYQRVLRLSPARRSESGSKRLGAIATGLADLNEILLFDATDATPLAKDIVQRITPKDNAEAGDVDMVEMKSEVFRVAYCTDYEVFMSEVKYDFAQKRAKETPKEPKEIHSSPPLSGSAGPGRPKFRSLRFLTPDIILLSANLPSFQGVHLILLAILPDGDTEVVLRKKLPSHVKATTGMDAVALDADPVTGAQQMVVAVAGQDNSVTLLALDYYGNRDEGISGFRTVGVTKDVHELQITDIRLSPFHPPATGQKSAKNQHIYLATISMGNTVVVDTLPLEAVSASNKTTRHLLLSAKSEALQSGLATLVAGFVLLIFLLAAQGFVAANYPNSTLAQFRVHHYIPEPIRDALGAFTPPGSRHEKVLEEAEPVAESTAEPVAKPVAEHVYEEVQTVLNGVEGIMAHPLYSGQKLRDLVHHFSSSYSFKPATSEVPGDHPPVGAVVVRQSDINPEDADALSTELHPDKESVLNQDTDAKRWEELSDGEKEMWKKRLIHVGAWALDEGETVLKGIFFSSYAETVGGIVAEALK